jgi:arsenate reductase (glutaredoxin)
MIVYGIKNCGSVKKALKFLQDHNISYEFHDLKNTPVACDKISKWLEHVSIDTLLNNRGTTYRTLGLKAMNLDDEGKKAYLCSHNMLIKRPVIEYNQKLYVGFDSKIYEGSFL